MSDFEHLVNQVLAIDGSKSKSDILADLQYTKSVEITVNRIFDGEFLKGTRRDPSTSALIILDSDDEDSGIDSNRAPSVPSNFQIKSLNSSGSRSITVPDKSTDVFLTNLELESQDSNEILHLSCSPPKSKEFDSFNDASTKHDAKLGAFDYNHEGDDELLLPSLPLDPSEEELHSPSISKKRSLLDFDSDCESLDSLPSVNDFFDQLLTQKREKPIVEIDDGDDNEHNTVDEAPVRDRKGKRRAFEPLDPSLGASQRPRVLLSDEDEEDWTVTLSAKEKKKLEAERKKCQQAETAEEKKRRQAEAYEEKKRKKAEALEEKKRLKEQKQLEKERQALFEKENRIRDNRKEILKEMILDVHPEFLKTKAGQLVERVLTRKEAQLCNLFLQDKDPQYTIAWRRKCQSQWSSDSQVFLPLESPEIVKEPVILVYIDINQFVQHIQADTVDDYIDQILQSSQNRQIMVLIEGLEPYYKKKMLHQRRQFENQVRNSISSLQTPATQKHKIGHGLTDVANGPGQAEIEATLNYLQLIRHIMLVQTKDDEDTASWIESLTTDLALGRYKSRNINNLYKVSKRGADPKDTFFKMLQEVQLCTPAIATSVMSAYPTVQALHQAYERKNVSEGELLLANLEVQRSALQVRDRKINRVMSKKIYAIFNSNDPDKIIY